MPTTVIQPALIDTQILSDTPNTNYGTAVSMTCSDGGGTTRRPLVEFDVSAIPPGSKISSAILSLYHSADAMVNGDIVYAYRILRDWVQLEATYNIWKAANNWQTAGCQGVLDRMFAYSGSCVFANGAAGRWRDFVMDTAEIEAMAGGSLDNYGWIIINAAGTDDWWTMHSSNYVADLTLRPKLTLIWQPPLGRLAHYIVDALAGGVRVSASMEPMANDLWTRYTPVGGSLTRSAHAEDAASQALYGIKEAPFGGGNASAAVAAQIAGTALQFSRSPLMADVQIDPGVVIRDPMGNEVLPEEVRPNRWLLIENLFQPSGVVYDSLVMDPAMHFIEELTYDEASGLHLVTSRERFAEALVSKLSEG